MSRLRSSLVQIFFGDHHVTIQCLLSCYSQADSHQGLRSGKGALGNDADLRSTVRYQSILLKKSVLRAVKKIVAPYAGQDFQDTRGYQS